MIYHRINDENGNILILITYVRVYINLLFFLLNYLFIIIAFIYYFIK